MNDPKTLPGLAYLALETGQGDEIYEMIDLAGDHPTTITRQEAAEWREMWQNTVDALRAINQQIQETNNQGAPTP